MVIRTVGVGVGVVVRVIRMQRRVEPPFIREKKSAGTEDASGVVQEGGVRVGL